VTGTGFAPGGKARSALAAIACLCALGCSADAVNLGQDPHVIWWTDHETGDLRDWYAGASNVAQDSWFLNGGSLSVTTDQARSGRYSMHAVAVASTSTSAGMLLRTDDLPPTAYYSAWFFVPESIASTSYWLIFKFRSRTDPSSSASDVELWDLDVVPRGGALALTVFRHTSSTDSSAGSGIDPEANVPIPLGRWFQIEAFIRAANDATGEFAIWQDGVQLYELHGPSAPSSYLQWSVGSAAEALSAGDAAVYIDDAAISRRRLGPTVPPFWRDQ